MRTVGLLLLGLVFGISAIHDGNKLKQPKQEGINKQQYPDEHLFI